MKKIFALVMAAVILTTTAMAADFIPGQKIRFNGNEDRWEGELRASTATTTPFPASSGSRARTWCPL